MGFERLPIKQRTVRPLTGLPESSMFKDVGSNLRGGTETISVQQTEEKISLNKIVSGPQSATSPTKQIPPLIADAALMTALVSGIATGILLELPEETLPPLEHFRSLIAGAILADNPKDYQNNRPAEISDKIFRAPPLEPKREKHQTPCSQLRKNLPKNVGHINRSWQYCLAPELSQTPQIASQSQKQRQHLLRDSERSRDAKR